MPNIPNLRDLFRVEQTLRRAEQAITAYRKAARAAAERDDYLPNPEQLTKLTTELVRHVGIANGVRRAAPAEPKFPSPELLAYRNGLIRDEDGELFLYHN